MTPYRYSEKDGVVTFHYKAKDLIPFMRLGLKEGNTGMILVRRKDNVLTYKGFGTIENPHTYVLTMTIVHHPLFGGEMPADWERCIKPKPLLDRLDAKMVMIDFSSKPIIISPKGYEPI